ncbi:MAG: hypothetical protein ACI8XC_004268 [Gammaproteobacteria bacterium]|jgi:hypothetical protein
MTQKLDTLERLNKMADKNKFTVEDLDWSRPISSNRLWGPEIIAPLSYLPAYNLLNEEERRRLNQLFSVGVCEQVIWLEENILVRTLRKALPHWSVSGELRTALENFIDEELKHTEMFWRTLEKAAPEWYPSRQFHLFKISKPQAFALNRVINNPDLLLVWIWTAIYFEERTVNYCQLYRRACRADPDSLDPTFVDLHEYHFKDEVRHFQLDQYLLTECYDGQPRWKRRLAGRMFYHVMKSYTAPRRTSLRILEIMGQEFPRLKQSIIPEFLHQIPSLATNSSFHRMAFSRESSPRSMELFARYDELDCLWPLFVMEGRDGSKPQELRP